MRLATELLQQCWFIAGPTASGKTATAIALAKALNGEILSLDSMAVFRHLDIGTAKPTAEEQAQVRHHLIDLIEPHAEFSTAEYLRAADTAVQDVLSRNKVPIFVGGTGLYLRSLLRGVFEGPAADWDYRHQLEAAAAQNGQEWLHARLAAVDPITAARLHPNDQRRVIRALEIWHLTGRAAAEQQSEQPLSLDQRPQHVYWLSPQREWLYDRINRRVEAMLAAGWVEEVDGLLKLDPPLSRTARQALGYQELMDWRAGRIESLAAAQELICTRTRQFAKRQHTWFRNLEECQPIEVPTENLVQQLLAR